MGVRKHKAKFKPQAAGHRLAAPKQKRRQPWAFSECKLAYLVQPFHLRSHASGAVPVSKLSTTSNISRIFQKPLRLYQGQLKEVKEYSTA